MKSFDLKMLESGEFDDKVTAKVRGHGSKPVEFDTVEVTYTTTIDLRKHCAKVLDDARDDGELENAAVVGLIFELAVHLIRKTVMPLMSNNDATRLISMTGGVRGDLVPQLAVRYGISDIILSTDDGGDEDELPM